VKDDFRRQFGTVWRMASSGLDTLREVVVRSSQSGRLRVDVALLQRERQQLLGDLGLHVAALVDSGKLELPEDAQALYEQIRDLETRIQSDLGRIHDNAYGAPRGYEPEAGNFDDDDLLSDEDDEDEHADVVTRRETR
jgi:hypothetical protein